MNKKKLTGNKEYAICKSCGKEYIKRSCIAKGGRNSSIRSVNTKTCSKKCSKEVLRISRLKKRKKLSGNKEYAICENCGKEYIKRIYTTTSKGTKIRGMNTKTCSRKCSKERPKVVRKYK